MKKINEGPGGGGGAATAADGVVRNRRRSPNQEQSVIVYDLISEGPIQGLINGASSIYLDTTQVLNNSYKTSHNPKRSFDVSYNATTNTITDNTNSNMFAGWDSSNGTYKIRINGAKKALSGISVTAGSKTITSSGGFALDDVNKSYGQYLRIAEGGINKTEFVARISKFTSATSVEVDKMPEITATGLTGTIDLCGTVTSKTNANIAVITPNTGGDRSLANTAAFMDSPTSVAEYEAANLNYNFDNVVYGFKTGERSQSYVSTAADIGSASVIANISKTLTTTDLSGIGVSNNYSTYGYGVKGDETSTWSANPIFITSTQMNLSTQKSAVDRLKLTFQYDSMYSLKSKDGNEKTASIEHRIYLRYKNPGDTDFTEDLIYGPTDTALLAREANKRVRGWDYSSSGTVEAYCKNPFVEVFDINLEPYQPLEDFEIKLETITPISRKHGGWTHQNSGRLQSIESVINDKLSYPLAAYGQMMFNASDFGNVPERGYHARGLKIMVPTNYSPAHELYEGQTSSYTRNITTGAVGTDYVAWDGNFRGDTNVFDASSPNFEKVYCNNPAWVFYDLVSNNRYGCGEYITTADIDKYALFKIARYCDELVPDGEGGTEPRFTANVWFTEQAEAMKVMQDMLSIFRGMMTWVNGQIVVEQNREKSPIAAFNKSNVLGGQFSYQSTRNRFRFNQVNVTWNDPKAFYKKTVEIVEDYDNIIETRQIKKKDVVAFGCTSRAQAVRYGKWHLFTDQMETDVVTFQVGLEGVNLHSGDVVTIADADRNNLRFGGRTLANSTTTNIKVDSALDLSNTSTYFMEVVFPEGGAYLQQDTATIRGASRKRGDFIQFADNTAGSNTALTSENVMLNVVDDNGNKLDLVWSGETRVERQEVSSYNATSVTVASAFTSAPATHSIWAIIELDADGQMVNGSAKEYMIQNIKEDDQEPTFAISAVEYNRNKFSLVDRGYVIEDLPETSRMPRYTEDVPFPSDVVLKAVPHQRESFDTTAESAQSSLLDLAITWGHPSTDRTDTNGNSITNKYEFIESYEVKHNLGFSGKFKTEIVPSTETSFLIENPAHKIGTVLVRLTNTQGHFSKWIRREIDTSLMVLKIPTSTTSKIGAIATGGGLSTGLSIDSSTGLVSLGSTTYDFSNEAGDRLNVSSGNAAQTSQAFSGLSDGGEAFVVYDFSDTADPLKAIEIKTDTTARNPNVGDNNEILFYNFEYVAEVGAANAGLTQKTGTVSIPQYSSEVTGSGTSFTTEYAVGDRIIIDTSTTRYFATVTSIQSDTKLFLDQSVPRSYSSVNIFKTSFISDNQDTVIGEVTRSGSTYTLVSFLSGGTGDDGDNSATVRIYQRSSSGSTPPSNPSGDTTYTFATGALSFTTANGWSGTVPTSGGKYLWTTQATVAGNQDTAVIEDSSWITGTIFVQDGDSGAAGINALLTNESATAETGSFTQGGTSITYSKAGGEMKVFQGTSELTSGVVYGISGGTVGGSTTTKTQNGLTLTINNSTGVYSLSGASWSTELENFTLTGTVTSASVTLEKEYSIDKGIIFATTHLTASSQSFNYDGNSANPSPSSITLTASVPNPFNFFGGYTYRFLKSTDGGANFSEVQARSSTRTHSVSAGALSLGNEIYKVEVYGANFLSGGTYVVDEDEMTLLRLKDGQQGEDGDDGEGNVNIYKRNSTLPSTPSAGTANPPTGWYSTIAAAVSAGSGILWVSIGNRPSGSTTITWNTPIRYVQDYDDVGGTKPPADANKFEKVDDTEQGRWRFKIDGGVVQDVDVFDSTERGKLANLRQGKAPGNANISIQNDSIVETDIVGSNKVFGAGQKPNKTTFADNSTQGVFTLTLDGSSSTVNVFDSTERGKLDNLRQGKAPGNANISIQNDSIVEADIVGGTKVFTGGKPNRTIVNSGSEEGRFTISNDGASADNIDVFTATERQKLANLRAGKVPGDGTGSTTASIANEDIAINATTGVITGITGDGIAIRNDKTTKDNVGLGNVPNTDATNASNISAGTININRTPTTVRNSTIAINATTGVITGITGDGIAVRNDKTTKDNVGLGNVPNTDATNASNISSGTINISRTPTTVRNSTVQLFANGVLSGAGTSTQVNIGSIAATPFNTSGDVDTGETIAVGSKITIDRDNERILIED